MLTNKKDNPLVEIALISPVGPSASTEANRTILAGWTYGLGKTVALTTDAGKRWATDWTHWDEYDKLFSQIVRWSMRPAGDQGKFTVTTDLENGKVRVTVTALDKDDEFLNFLEHERQRRRARHEADRSESPPDGAGPICGRVRFAAIGQLFHDAQPRRRHVADSFGRERAVFGRIFGS